MAEAEQKTKPEAGAEKEPPKGGSKVTPVVTAPSSSRTLYITLAVVLLLLPIIGFAIAHFVLAPKIAAVRDTAAVTMDPGGHSSSEGKPKPGADDDRFSLTDLVVNVKGTRGTRFMRASLQIDGPPAVLEELKKSKVKIQDIVTSTMGSKKLEDFEADDFRQKLKIEIATLINAVLKTGEITEINLGDVVIQ